MPAKSVDLTHGAVKHDLDVEGRHVGIVQEEAHVVKEPQSVLQLLRTDFHFHCQLFAPLQTHGAHFQTAHEEVECKPGGRNFHLLEALPDDLLPSLLVLLDLFLAS